MSLKPAVQMLKLLFFFITLYSTQAEGQVLQIATACSKLLSDKNVLKL